MTNRFKFLRTFLDEGETVSRVHPRRRKSWSFN